MRKSLAILLLAFPLWGATPDPLSPTTSEKKITPGKAAEKIFTFDIGFGIPNLIMGEVEMMVLPHFQAGLSYGLFPGQMSFAPQLSLADRLIQLPNGRRVVLLPTVSTALDSICPFVRFYPSSTNNFYIQVTYAFLRTVSNVTSPLYTVFNQEIPGASVNAKVTHLQHMPTLAIGHMFMAKMLFINLSLGISWLSSLTASTEVGATVPDSLGGSSANQTISDEVNAVVNSGTSEASDAVRAQGVLIPSLQLSFGFAF